MSINEYIGYGGSLLVLAAYIPQIYHLIKARCSAGVSRKAFLIWLVSSVLLIIHAVLINELVLIFLQTINLLSTSVILFYAQKYKNKVCEIHKNKLSSSKIG
jgi:uncharacterized protein with PQ loop repeat